MLPHIFENKRIECLFTNKPNQKCKCDDTYRISYRYLKIVSIDSLANAIFYSVPIFELKIKRFKLISAQNLENVVRRIHL